MTLLEKLALAVVALSCTVLLSIAVAMICAVTMSCHGTRAAIAALRKVGAMQ